MSVTSADWNSFREALIVWANKLQPDVAQPWFTAREAVIALSNIDWSAVGSGSSGNNDYTEGGGEWWKYDEENDAIYSEKTVYSLGDVAAFGYGTGSGGDGSVPGEGGLNEEDRELLDNLSKWWKFDDVNGAVYSTYNIYSTKEVAAYGFGELGEEVTVGALSDLRDVVFTDPIGNNNIFQFDDVLNKWTNKPFPKIVTEWDDIDNKPEFFKPTEHTHKIDDIINLSDVLLSKLDKSVFDDIFEVTVINGEKVLHVKGNLYADKEIAAYGYGTTGEESGVYWLENLKDVKLTELKNGQILKYVDPLWINVDIPDLGITSDLEEILDNIAYRFNIIDGAIKSLNSSVNTLSISITGIQNDLNLKLDKATFDNFFTLKTHGNKVWIEAKYDFYSLGEVAAYGFGSEDENTSITYLENLKDVELTNLQNNQILIYDDYNDRWINQDLVPSVSSLKELTDTNISNETIGQALILSDTLEWKNISIAKVATTGQYSDLLNLPSIYTKTEVDNKINDIKIGGRNLLKDSEKEHYVSSSFQVWDLTEPLKQGEVYILSFEAKRASKGYQITPYFRGASGALLYFNIITISNEWTRYITEVKVITANVTSAIQMAVHFNNPSACNGYIRKAKLERGNKVSDWTPAPEDKLDKSIFDDLFEKVTIDGASYIKANYGLYSVGEVAAYGFGEGGGNTSIFNLEDLEDVDLSQPVSSGQVLQYINNKWTNSTLSVAGGTGKLELRTAINSGLSGNADFQMSQTGVTTFTVSVDSNYQIPTKTQISNWDSMSGGSSSNKIAIGGSDGDMIMTGLYDRNVLAFVNKWGLSITINTKNATLSTSYNEAKIRLFNQKSDYVLWTGVKSTTQIEIIINISSVDNIVYDNIYSWAPFIQYGVAPSGETATTVFRSFKVEFGSSSTSWYSANKYEVNDITVEDFKNLMHIGPEKSDWGTTTPKYIRFTLSNPVGSATNVRLISVGLKHKASTYAPQYPHILDNTSIYGKYKFLSGIILGTGWSMDPSLINNIPVLLINYYGLPKFRLYSSGDFEAVGEIVAHKA